VYATVEDSQLEAILEDRSIGVRNETDRSGAFIRHYASPSGNNWMIKSVKFGLLFTDMCNKCTKQEKCGEGVFTLRVDSEGCFRPCLLRPDLERICQDKLSRDTVMETFISCIQTMFPPINPSTR
jgi:hypothetical protein